MNDFPLKGWVPYKIAVADGHTQCQWLNTFSKPFTEPFFDESISKCKAINNQHVKMASVSELCMVKHWSADVDSIVPSAFIFHISRCGSTLVSQLLAGCSQHIVLSEVPFFDDVLRLPFKDPNYTPSITSELLAAAIKFYGQRKNKNEQYLFIKTDSWHIFFYEQLRKLYPSVPFILMYRSPDEVFKSHVKVKGMQAVPGLIESQLFGFDPAEIVYDDLDTYLAKVIESYLNRYLDITKKDNLSLLINYNEGPIPIIEKIAAFTDTTLSDTDKLSMRERSLYHSKKTSERFHEEATTFVPACLNKAMELYHRLEEKRNGTDNRR